MAMCDYYLCDVCGKKCFYDAAIAEYDDDNRYLLSGSAVGIAAICESCNKTHKCVVVPRETHGRTNARFLWIAGQLATEAKMATNALACAAKAQYQHAEVTRLHIAIDLLKDELVGYHGNQPISEASGSAQSEAQKEEASNGPDLSVKVPHA